MKIAVSVAALAATMSLASAARADTVYDTSLANLNGSFGAGIATTTTGPNGTVTTVAGPSGGGNRADAPVSAEAWAQHSVGGNASVGITTDYARSGNGSAFFQGTDGASKADLEYYFEGPKLLSNVQSLSYDWYRDATSTTNAIQVTSLRLMVATQTSTAYLVYEPYYSGVNPIPTDSWNTSTITGDSIFWSNNATLALPAGTSSCAIGCFAKLSDWQAANPGVIVFGLSTGIGSGWSGSFKGAVDNIAYDFGSDGSGSWNFEVNAVPEPASWAMMIAGFGLVGLGMRRRNARTVLA